MITFFIFQIDVTVAGLHGTGPVKCSRNVVIVPDKCLEEATKTVCKTWNMKWSNLVNILREGTTLVM